MNCNKFKNWLMSWAGVGQGAGLETYEFLDEVTTSWKQLKAFTEKFEVFDGNTIANLKRSQLPIDLKNSSMVAGIAEELP